MRNTQEAKYSPELRIADNVRLIHKATHKMLWRASKASQNGMTYDDLFNELAIVWIKAREKFDPTRGFKFSTYYMNSVINYVNSMGIKGNRDPRYLSNFQTIEGDCGFEMIADDRASTHDDVELGDLVNSLMMSVSKRSRQVLSLVLDPPDEMVESYGKLCQEPGRNVSWIVYACDCMGMKAGPRAKTIQEIKTALVKLGVCDAAKLFRLRNLQD